MTKRISLAELSTMLFFLKTLSRIALKFRGWKIFSRTTKTPKGA